MIYQLGPLRIRAESWPSQWSEHAQRWLAPDQVDPIDVTVAYAGLGVADDEIRARPAVEQVMIETCIGPGQWRLAGRSFVAELDEHALRLDVKQVRGELDHPMLTLGNPLRGLVATWLPTRWDGLMLHGCSGILDEEGVVIAGVSTAGKTTLALGFSDVTYLGDDVALVVHASTAPTLTASPFFGSAGVQGADRSAPLRAVAVLVGKVIDGPSTYLRVPPARAALELLRHVASFTKDRALVQRLLDVTGALVQRVPVVLVQRSLADASDDVVRSVLRVAAEPP